LILRLLIWIVIFFGLSWLLRRMLGGGGRRPVPPVGGRHDRSGTVPPRSGGRMVRDLVCDTYLPEDRALVHRDAEGASHFFCSEACRSRFLAERGS
jgi:YHS domain-containing protein